MLLRMAAIGSMRLSFAPPLGTASLGPRLDDFLASPEAFIRGFPLPGIGLVFLALGLFLLALDRVKATRLAFLLLIVLSGAGLAFAVVRPDSGSNALFAGYAATPVLAIPVEASDASLGSLRAPARLVVFSSFQCDWCRGFAPIIRRLRGRFGDRVAIVFKNFPLGKDCNPALQFEMQPRACAAAWAAAAANLQGGFWRYHDRLFAGSLVHSEEELQAAAAAAGLDLEQWEQKRQSPEVRLKVQDDVRLGLQLGIIGTPTVFLNGRIIADPSVVVLTTLIRQLTE
jgi:protein-disulfide isomerase